METWGGGTRHLREGGVRDIRSSRQLGGAEAACLLGHAVEFVLWDTAEHGVGALAGRRDDDEVAEAFEQVFDKATRILAGLDDAVDRGEGGGGIPGTDRIDHLIEEGAVREAEQRDGTGVVDVHADRLRGDLRTGHQLVEQRQRVAHRAPTRANDETEHARRDGDVFRIAELLHVFEHLRGRHEPERIVVRARPNGTDDLFGFGRGEDELDVLGRLFDDLQQRIEALRRHHVRLVEDEDLVAIPGWREDCAFTDVTGVIHTVVTRRVDLDYIQRAAAITAELDAAWTHAARRIRRTLCAVEAPGEDARRGGLAAAAGSAEEVRVVDPVGAEGRAQRIGHLRLADQFGEGLRAIPAVQGCGH